MRDLWHRTRHDQDGAAIVLLSFMLLFLLGISAFAVDLGWLWVNGSRVQRAADSAALAGVTNLPADSTGAFLQASNASRANGFEHGTNASVAPSIVGDNQLQVTVSAQIPTFFLRVFGQNPVTITKTATAEYVLPVALGSPFSGFGTGNSMPPAPGQPPLNFWASISGEWADRINGDPFATRCIDDIETDDPDGPPCPSPVNPTYRSTGYHLGIDVLPGSTTLGVQIYDAAFVDRGSASIDTGERLLGGSTTGPNTTYQLFESDTTPYDLSDLGAPTCSMTANAEDTAFLNSWVTLCTINNPRPGLWVLRVTTADGGSNNAYGVRASASGAANPRVAGINDIGIFANVSAGTTNLYLAEIPPVHAGKTLLVSFFDAGDTNGGTAFLQIQTPPGVPAPVCSWQVRGGGGSGNSCQIQTTFTGSNPKPYNGKWIDWTIQIPDSAAYNCDPLSATGCWWRVEYDYSQQATDRTTWTASVIGNPVRLVPNP